MLEHIVKAIDVQRVGVPLYVPLDERTHTFVEVPELPRRYVPTQGLFIVPFRDLDLPVMVRLHHREFIRNKQQGFGSRTEQTHVHIVYLLQSVETAFERLDGRARVTVQLELIQFGCRDLTFQRKRFTDGIFP